MPGRRLPRIVVALGVLLAGLVGAVVPSGTALAATITSAGPLRSINISPQLNCAVSHTLDIYPEWYGTDACATLVAINGVLYGPSSIPAGGGASPRTTYTPVSQTPVTGSGTAADPYTIVTVVRAGNVAELTQTDTYVTGDEFYATRVSVQNLTDHPLSGQMYTAGDCYLQNSDWGYGSISGGSPRCVASTEPGARLMSLVPSTTGSHYYLNWYYDIWDWIGAQDAFPDACNCSQFIDNGMGLSWPLRVSPGTLEQVFAWDTNFSPLGNAPLQVVAIAHRPNSNPGDFNGYRVTILNPNPEAATVNEISVTLPPGFTYVSHSTIGETDADPTISGQTLTWTGPFGIDGAGQISLDIDVRVAPTLGSYTIDARATANHDVTDDLDAALIAVEAAADLELAKTASVTETARSSAFTYTLTAQNIGPSVVPDAFITDTLPTGLTFNAATSSSSCFVVTGQDVRCNLGEMPVGQVDQVVIGVTVSSSAPLGYLYNQAQLQGNTNDQDKLNNLAVAPVLITGNPFAISKTARPVYAGENMTWNMLATNETGTPQTGFVVTDKLPVDTTFVSASTPGGSCSYDDTTIEVTCHLAAIPANGSLPVTMVVKTPSTLVPGIDFQITSQNTAVLTSPSGPADTTVFNGTVFSYAHIVPFKTVSPTTVLPGGLLTYDVGAENEGPSAATVVTITDTLPSGVTFDAARSDSRCRLLDAATNTIRCVDDGPVPAGDSARFTVVAQVSETQGAGSELINDAYAAAPQYDETTANAARALATVTEDPAAQDAADLTITKKASSSRVLAGHGFTYTITVYNHGPAAAKNLVVADKVNGTGEGGGVRDGVKGGHNCPVQGVSFQCDIPELLAGNTATFIIPVTVGRNVFDGTQICDEATVTSDESRASAQQACVVVSNPSLRPFVSVTG